MEELYGWRDLIFDIEHSSAQKPHKFKIPRSFQLEPDIELITNLSGNYGALFMRAILNKLGLNEHHLFKWRLEHKLNQYYVLNYYHPGCMPETLSFAEVFSEVDGLERINALLKEGFFIKATLGDASFANNNWNRTGELDEIIIIQKEELNKKQPYLLQKKLHLESEYRIHTFCQEIIPALTFITQGLNTRSNKTSAERFLNEVLVSLPRCISEGAFIAWDVGITQDHKCFIIEGNFTGYHPEYRAGFQTTGYVDNHIYGPIICAWLNKYFHINWDISVKSIENGLYKQYPFYRYFVYYNSILNDTHLKVLQDKMEGIMTSAIIYIDHENIELIKRLIAYFLLVDFAGSYNLITHESIHATIRIFYWGNQLVNVFNEKELFTEDQEKVVERFFVERRKQICRFHLIRKLKSQSYILI